MLPNHVKPCKTINVIENEIVNQFIVIKMGLVNGKNQINRKSIESIDNLLIIPLNILPTKNLVKLNV
jgi:hypothetical protein